MIEGADDVSRRPAVEVAVTVIRRKALLGAVASVGLVLAAAITFLSPAGSLTNCSVSGAEQAIDAEEQQMLTLINQYRAEHGRNPLSLDSAVSRAAAWFSRDMADKNYFPQSHADSFGRNPGVRLAQCDVAWTEYAENIAAGNPGAEATFLQWRNSPSHNTNMLLPGVNLAGIGRAFSAASTYGWYWTLDVTAGQSATTTSSSTSSTVPSPTTSSSTSSSTSTTATTLPVSSTTIVTLPGASSSTTSTLPSFTSSTTTSLTSTTTTTPAPSSDETCAQLATQQATFNTSIDRGEAKVRDSLSGAWETAALDHLTRQRSQANARFTALQADCDPVVVAEAHAAAVAAASEVDDAG